MDLVSRVKSSIPESIKSPLRKTIRRVRLRNYDVPEHLAKKHRKVDDAGIAAVRKSIQSNYHVGWRARERYSRKAYREDLDAHLLDRLESDRKLVVPWLDTLKPLSGLRILEMGCGTGSSTVALAEQGAVVVGIDVDQGAMRVAQDRCKVYGVDADFRLMNAAEIDDTFDNNSFDFILFFACLEHMTLTERLTSLSRTWDMLPPGGMLGVVESPNRLWFYDDHTSRLPFFNWLPNDLAFMYSRFSPRENFHELYHEWTSVAEKDFLRRGRGLSYHEFDLAIGPVQDFTIAGSLSAFFLQHGILKPSATEVAYTELLQQQCPKVHPSFFQKQLDLVIEKRD